MLGGVDVDGHDVTVLARRGDHLDRARDWGASLAASIAAGTVPG